ncbi:ABC transporter permease [Arthrobacter globiformis]|uniref:ABC transporter permease n=1 Tax=Arthrobacter globiformis TaxID=1665 RepID=UPI0027879384|nr:ABC transporter permease [Arthrobacter globiformis]MDQ0864501.1 ribose transport system permease protein [Arthrobacter globiformis]MDQ1060479.1 ribose transport system permease protein [Arthrobacter globiformis]
MNFQRTTSRVLSTTGVPIAIALVIVVIVFQIMSPVFLTPGSVRDYINNAIPILLLTVGVSIVIVGGGIDLSVGTVAGLSAGTTMWTLVSGAPTWIAVLVGVGTGLVFGLFNGLMITRFGINDFIVTLATLNIAGGLLIVLTEQVPLQGVTTPGFSEIVYGNLLGIPNAFWIAAILFVLMQFFLIKTIFGRRIFAIGIGASAANVAGVNVNRVRLETFVLSGLLAGAAGVLLASRLGAVQAFLGNGYEFVAIAGAVLGGVSLAGGRGSVWAAVAGGLMLASLQQGLRLNGVDPVYFSIVTGLCIVAGVVFDRRIQQFALSSIRRRGGRTSSTPPPTTKSDRENHLLSTGKQD